MRGHLSHRAFATLIFCTAAALSTVARDARAADATTVNDGFTIGSSPSGGLANANALAWTEISTGAASATIPFQLNTARGGPQPSLSLVYSSNGGTREAGWGWGLSLPTIERKNLSGPPRYNDPAPGQALDPNAVDRFVIGGQDLVPICFIASGAHCSSDRYADEPMPDWTQGGGWHYFRLQNDGSFDRFFWSPDHLTWRVQHKSGSVDEFGVALTRPMPSLDGGVDYDRKCTSPNPTCLYDYPQTNCGPGACVPERTNCIQGWSCSQVAFRWNLVRSFDLHGGAAPSNVVAYQWKHGVFSHLFGEEPCNEKINGINVPCTLPGILSDIYDTPPSPESSFDDFAHHVSLSYDWRDGFLRTPIWRASPAARLTHVNVASKSFDASGPREIVRRYHLGYESKFGHSYLTSVQLEGRCDSPVTELPGGDVTPTTNCPMSPAVASIEYSEPHPEPDPSAVLLVGGPSETPRTSSCGDKCPATAYGASVVDIDADGLPDIVINHLEKGDYASPQPTSKMDVWYLGAPSARLAFQLQTANVPGTTGLPSSQPIFIPPNAMLGAVTMQSGIWGDWSGSGRLGLISFAHHNLGQDSYDVYDKLVLAASNRNFDWNVAAANIGAPNYPPRSSDFSYFVDVDGDGLVDALANESSGDYVSTAQQYVPSGGAGTFFATANTVRSPNGQYTPFVKNPNTCLRRGHAAFVQQAATSLGNPSTFEDHSDFADMNGDGILDEVALDSSSGTVTYWPGDGYGSFGWFSPTGANSDTSMCPGVNNCFGTGGASSCAVALNVTMSPQVFVGHAYFHDVTGDGLADLIEVGSFGVRVWPNVDGTRFGDLIDLPASRFVGWNPNDAAGVYSAGSEYATLRFADVFQQGFDQIIIFYGGQQQKSGAVSEELGALVYPFTYYTGSVNISVVNLMAGTRPGLLKRVTNGLGASRSFEYRSLADLAWEAKSNGNPWTYTSPQATQVVVKETTDNGLPYETYGYSTSNEYVYRDAMYDGWKKRFRGFRSVEVTRRGGANTATVRTAHTFDIDPCNSANANCDPATYDDGAGHVRGPLPTVTQTFDGNHLAYDWIGRAYTTVDLYSGMDGRTVRSTYLSSTTSQIFDSSGAGTPPQYNLRTELTLDRWGNALTSIDRGRLDASGAAVDEPIVVTNTWFPVTGDWKARQQTRTTSPFASVQAEQTHSYRYEYTSQGDVLAIYGTLAGTQLLDRVHEDSSQPTAPPPADASVDGEIQLEKRGYDEFGNVVDSWGPNGRHVHTTYDAAFNQLVVSVATDTGSSTLSTTWRYDRGFETVTMNTATNGAVSTATYDNFGRMHDVTAPDRDLGIVRATPTLSFEYLVAANGPTHRVHTIINLGQTGSYSTWSYVDGLGNVLLQLEPADANEGGPWIARGLQSRERGLVTQRFMPWSYNGDPSAYPLATPRSAYVRLVYDAMDRVTQVYDIDGSQQLQRKFMGGLYSQIWDAENLNGGHHAGAYASVQFDGHGRLIQEGKILRTSGKTDTVSKSYVYQATGELVRITQSHSADTDTVVRNAQYDSLGRLVLNMEPNSSFFAIYGRTGAHGWRYAYDDAGDLVGTSDARGCGENLGYDATGRLLSEDYSPCLSSQPAYSAPQADGSGLEAMFIYDAPEPGQSTDFGPNPAFLAGRLAAVLDRGSHTRYAYDALGRSVGIARQVTRPIDQRSGAPDVPLANRYAPWWFRRALSYDDAGRVVQASTGADVPELFGADGQSVVTASYTTRSFLQSAGGSYGTLIASQSYEVDGLLKSQTLGDTAGTQTTLLYNARRLPFVYTVSRGAFAPASNPQTQQTVLANYVYAYDGVNNPISIQDYRTADEWADGYKPVTKTMQYDDLYRLTSVYYQYPAGADVQVSPFGPEYKNVDTATHVGAKPVPTRTLPTRVLAQSFAYDWKGNTTSTRDDTNGKGFYDRSLGTITNGNGLRQPNQLRAAGAALTRQGNGIVANADGLVAKYDLAGNLVDLVVSRTGPCDSPTNECSHRFIYDWDEVGRLANARRYDFGPNETINTTSQGFGRADVEMAYEYSGANRILQARTIRGASLPTTYSLNVFSTLRLSHAQYLPSTDSYERDASKEIVYLGGVARLVPADASLPGSTDKPHVLFEIGDHLGSTSSVIDKETSELVSQTTFGAYGTTDSDYRPDRWGAFRETYRYTGKEDDFEVGLTYFGARYYHAALGRWISPDPLTIHRAAADLNPYAFVNGSPLRYTDPTGLCPEAGCPPPPPPPDDNGKGPDPIYPPGDAGANDVSGSGSGYRDPESCNGPCKVTVAPSVTISTTTESSPASETTLAIIGYGFGLLQGLAPGGIAAAVIPLPVRERSAAFRFWEGAGQISGGVLAVNLGSFMIAGGGTLSLTIAGATIGIPIAGVGVAEVSNGVVAVGVGFTNLQMAARKTGGGSSSSSSSTATNGSGGGTSPTGRNPQGGIDTSGRGLQHAIDRHTVGGSQNVNASTFNQGENLQSLVQAAEGLPATPQRGGNFQTIVNAGRSIGIDRATGAATQTYTVITTPTGGLVTLFPGVP